MVCVSTRWRAKVADGGEPLLLRREDGSDGVLRVSACRDGHEYVAGLSQSVDLVGEGLVVAVVVGDSGEGGGVCVEGERWQRRPIPLELADKLRDEVLGLCGGSAVATREHLASPLIAINDKSCRLLGCAGRKARKHPARPVRPITGPVRRGAITQGAVHRRVPGVSVWPLLSRHRATEDTRAASMASQ